jgi:hypothetical protein
MLALYLLSMAILPCLISSEARSAEGDQFLDGIGETALIARYLFNGNVEDRSRNSFHAALHGQQAAFVAMTVRQSPVPAWGNEWRVCSDPGQALIVIENLSVTGWIHIKI